MIKLPLIQTAIFNSYAHKYTTPPDKSQGLYGISFGLVTWVESGWRSDVHEVSLPAWFLVDYRVSRILRPCPKGSLFSVGAPAHEGPLTGHLGPPLLLRCRVRPMDGEFLRR